MAPLRDLGHSLLTFHCLSAVAILKVLAEERLEQFADRVQTRIIQGKTATVEDSQAQHQQQQCDDFVHKHEGIFQAFLTQSGESWHLLLSEAKSCVAMVNTPCCRSSRNP